MPFVEYIGILAGLLTTFCFIPQVIKIQQTRDARSISGLMYTIMCAGFSLWLIYGIAIFSLPIMLANAVSLSLGIYVLVLKTLYNKSILSPPS